MHNAMKLLTNNSGILKRLTLLKHESGQLNPLYRTEYVRHASTITPMNTIIMFVPQQEAWIVERMGKFHKILEPGFNILLPIIDKVKYVQSLKEICVEVPNQSAITSDNVTLNIDGVLYLRINDPYLASYGVEDAEFAIRQLAQTTMRSELGKISLDKVFREREGLNISIVESINKASEAWGITCLRYEILDIKLPDKVQEAMQMQVEAERKKRAAILESEGVRTAEINIAEGKRSARILASEAARQEQINNASGEAAALVAVAEARAKSLQLVASSLSLKDAKNAAALSIAEQYVHAFNKLAKVNNTIILPNNVGDATSLITQAMSIYKHLLPQSDLKQQNESNDNQFQKSVLVEIDKSDEEYEYLSDKKEKEKHRESEQSKYSSDKEEKEKLKESEQPQYSSDKKEKEKHKENEQSQHFTDKKEKDKYRENEQSQYSSDKKEEKHKENEQESRSL